MPVGWGRGVSWIAPTFTDSFSMPPFIVISVAAIVSIAPAIPKQTPTDLQLAVNYNPPNRGAPGNSTGHAGSRPACPPVSTKPFAAFAPAMNFGLTAGESPRFWLYVPYESGRVEGVFRDEQTQDEVYQTTVDATQAGLLGVPISDAGLEVDRSYTWEFKLFCNPDNDDDYLSITGVIARELPDGELESNLEAATPVERVHLWAESGVWYETMDELVQLRCANPEDAELAADWADLMRHPAVGLDEFVDVSIDSGCETANSEP